MQATTTTKNELPDMEANNSIGFQDKEVNQRHIVKRDGSKIAYDESKLRAYLQTLTEGLNAQFMDLDLIIKKVSVGLYNGKLTTLSQELGLLLKWPNVCPLHLFNYSRDMQP